jgi:UDP-2-acetamido-3-amino-2,3-dideoxy-glucuronate N-acetyltransferase
METTVLIHPSAQVSDGARIGSGTRIWNNCQIRENATIGRDCILGKDVYVDFGVEIGDKVKIQNGAYVYHGTTIESGVFIGPGVIFTNDKIPRSINPQETIKGNDDWQVGTIHISYGASIGAGAVILPNVTVGRFALVGAGAIVTANVPEHTMVVGNPARFVGYVCRCGIKLVPDELGIYHCYACDEVFRF